MDLSASDLIARLKENLAADRKILAQFLKVLGEVDRRRLYLGQGYPSLYAFLVEGLRLSEDSSYRRIQVARAARKFPEVLEAIENGDLHLSGMTVLAPVLTNENCSRLLGSSKHKSKREIDRLVSDLSIEMVRVPPDAIRRLPGRKTSPSFSEVGSTPKTSGQERDSLRGVVPKSTLNVQGDRISDSHSQETPPPVPVYVPEKRRVSIHFVADEDFLKALDDARALMRHKYPAGRLEDVFGEALRIYLERKNPQRSLPSRQLAPPNASRNIPAYVKALVWKRDQGRCTFVSPEKKRCDAREGLEFDHKIPWSMGGRSTERNLRLLCRAHNQHAARMAFGEKWIEKKIEETKSRR